jgi:hypothetical protein
MIRFRRSCSSRIRSPQHRKKTLGQGPLGVEWFPRADGYSTVCVPPPIASLAELARWVRTKEDGTNSAEGFIQSLGEDEGILYADMDALAVRFPRYFYPRLLRAGGAGRPGR